VKPKPAEFGFIVAGHDHPVFNERAIRASAGLLFVFGFAGWMTAALTDDFSLLRTFGAYFMFEMFMRLFVSARFTPSLAIADFLVRKQRPEWVDALPKRTAWYIGFGLVVTACFMMGWLQVRNEIVLALCGFCMTFLFAEAAIGFCVGCWLHLRFAKNKPQHCSGDVCSYDPADADTRG
jgi:hypothetical protein